VALVLTLIMLAIITIVTVVFLATARRQRQSTTVRLDQTSSEQAAEMAYQRAVAEIMTNILDARIRGTTNRAPSLLSFDFFVSRSGPTVNVANASNTVGNYLDLNRNRQFENPNEPTNYPYGDPIWIAAFDKPWATNQLNTPNNRALYRYAYVVLPAGKSLDLNTIHNAASSANGYQYVRNQGFSPGELNLGAFFAELNPDVWFQTPGSGQAEYTYGPFPTPIAGGDAFVDARAVVDYRAAWARQLTPFGALYPQALQPGTPFPPGSIDLYLDGINGTVLGANPFVPDDDAANPTKLIQRHWPTAAPTNHWFHPQEWFHITNIYAPNQVTMDFATNLLRAINGWPADNIVGDPTCYYRMIAQLSTDTGSDLDDRININYADWHADDGSGFEYAPTNFVSWDASPALAVSFFTNVAERIFRAQFDEFNPINATNQVTNIWSMTQIPVYPTNFYTTAIHRILQMAANIFDATRTNPYPSVFRPIFGSGPQPGVTYIVGYTNDDRVSTLQTWLDNNTNGIPLVVGAKKGFPNFNEYTVRSDITMTRKLEVRRSAPVPNGGPIGTNQMYVLAVSNEFSVEGWNPYYFRYPRPVTLTISNFASLWMSNDLGFQTNQVMTVAAQKPLAANAWRGAGDMRLNFQQSTNSFLVPLSTNQIFLSNAVYRFNDNKFYNVSTNEFETTTTPFPLPYWVFGISNRMTYLMSEVAGGYERIVDFVLLKDNHVVDLFSDLVGAQNPYENTGAPSTIAAVWDTNRVSATAPPDGVRQQMQIALGIVPPGTSPPTDSDWRSFARAQVASEDDKKAAIDAFRVFNNLTPNGTNQVQTNYSLAMEAPFNPAAKISAVTTWQANDPLVHYHVTDLRMGESTKHQYLRPSQPGTNISPASIGRLNDRYSPWGGRPNTSAGDEDASFYDRKVKDAGVFTSDDWGFPSNKLATIGLLGRVHRGTPWQTIYLKSEVAPLIGQTVGWTNFSADIALRINGDRYSRTHPTNDWRLMDMFTTGLDEATSSGLVSINQTNVETWSALLSGVVVLSNSMDNPGIGQTRQYTEMLIEPWGQRPVNQSSLAQIWTNIHHFQTNQGRPLTSVGDLLQLTNLTVGSPFLNLSSGEQLQWGIDDFAYEWIPQQILSLLRVGEPRFVIYAYGQALRPADIDPASGRVRNYQVTAEHVTRTVVRLEGDPRSRVRAVVESFNVLPPD